MIDDHIFAIYLSLLCGFWSTLLNLPWGIFWGWVLARKDFKGKTLIQTLLFIPLVLPPILTGYFLLMVFSRKAWLGQWLWDVFAFRFFLDWKGTVLAATVVSSPFMIHFCQRAFAGVDRRLEFAARNLGASWGRMFRTVTLPLTWPHIIGGMFLVFARSIGEFGATVILAGNIPGKTQTIPLAIYHEVSLGQEKEMLPLAVIAILLAYIGLGLNYFFTQKGQEITHAD